MVTLNWFQDLLLPFVVGVVIPFLTNWTQKLGWPEDVETLLNFALSAAASVIINVQFDGDWKGYLTALGVAWGWSYAWTLHRVTTDAVLQSGDGATR